ncbi:MAG: OmpA family protein [Pseudomonadota bacterium]
MKNAHLPTLFAMALLVGACSSGPSSTTLLEQTRSEYQMAQNNPAVASYAPLEMKQASDALAQANTAASLNERAETVDKLAYIARQKIALAQEVAKQKSAEAEVVKAARERDQILLEKRASEANQAKLSAEQAQARAAQLEAQLAELAAKKTERGMVITLGNVLFGTDQARLNAQGIRVAQKLATVLQQNPQRTVLIEGFTDSTGTAAHNQQLSERRANAVRTALLDLGVAQERIATQGYGEAYPIAPNDTAQNRQLNRRVEIVLSDDSGKVMAR